LTEFLSRQTQVINESTILDLFCHIASTLECLHNQNKFHHNLNTRKVLLTKNLEIKLIAFGVSKLIEQTKMMSEIEENILTIA
jgi:serine/threonine protein kinase